LTRDRRGPLDISPPDDSETTTFRRYQYQAELAFSFRLDVGLIGNVAVVVPEHLEDVAVGLGDGKLGLPPNQDTRLEPFVRVRLDDSNRLIPSEVT